MNKENDIKRIQEAILSEGQQAVSLADAKNFWTRYSDSIGFEWAPVPDHPIDTYSMIEVWVIEWVFKRKRR